jgi:DNA polymerase-3 subunit epsilon
MTGRQIVWDTETTGTNKKTDRVCEIGAVEIEDFIPTGRTFHEYINPQHPVHPGAFNVHGLSNDFLKAFPTFRRMHKRFLDFVGNAPLVAHNSSFDVDMVNAELERLGLPPLSNPIIDTLPLARRVKKGGLHNLDALCSHFGVDTTRRTKHGALVDSEILAEVYLHLNGGRQFGMTLSPETVDNPLISVGKYGSRLFTVRSTTQEREAHAAFIQGLGPKAIWQRYLEGRSDA